MNPSDGETLLKRKKKIFFAKVCPEFLVENSENDPVLMGHEAPWGDPQKCADLSHKNTWVTLRKKRTNHAQFLPNNFGCTKCSAS
jgi:hypothetical protein